MNKKTLELVLRIPGWLTVNEGKFLEKAAASLSHVAGSIVEIGSFQGKSTIWLSQADLPVFAVDPHKGEVSGGKTPPTLAAFHKHLKEAGVDHLVRALVMTSAEAAKDWDKPVKLIFIDGLHDHAHALEDFSLWWPHVVPGGFVVMHDAFCGWLGAGDVAMRHIVYSPEFAQIGVVGSIIYGVKGTPTFLGMVNKWRNQLVIELCQWIYRSGLFHRHVAFLIVHKFLKIFLINRFTFSMIT